MKQDRILLGHGSGGKLMHDLIENLFLKYLNNPYLKDLSDAAVVKFKNRRLAFTTDSFVVKPLFFPGGDIGKLAVFGTVNDLAVTGARPLFLSCAMIVQEGLPISVLEKITKSLAEAAGKAKVEIITGDFKVVEKESCDGIFVNTAGIGEIVEKADISMKNIKPGDKIIINGPIGQHGIAVLAARKELDFNFKIKSDCADLSGLVIPLLKETSGIKFMRDPTRGGLATTLNEITDKTGLEIFLDENKIPISKSVKASCEILGLDPLYIANEGKVVLIVDSKKAENILKKIRRHSLGKYSQLIGEVVNKPKGKVCLNTSVGGRRIIDMLTSEMLPRIC
ncbi:MAG: hydrogenase expression/formation protein HypE [Candidatus Omnitrophica bacterium]|nr:hydrogenase expression/formation protein HypE [Candidatus Omnitrophota bacterium]